MQKFGFPQKGRVGIAGGPGGSFDPQLIFQPHIAYCSSTIMTLAVH